MSQPFAPPAPPQTFVGVIRAVTQRNVSKKDGTPLTMFDVSVEGFGELLSTANRKVANTAYDLINQSATVTYVMKVNGAYTNYYINDAVPNLGNYNPTADAAALTQQLVPQQPMPADPIPVTSHGADRDLNIHRQTATKVAAVLVGSAGTPANFWENVETLLHYYETGEKPESFDPDADIPF